MTFNTPTTKEEMINTIKEIFMYYRNRREIYVEEEMEELVIERVSFNRLTEEELREKACLLLKPSFTLRVENYKRELLEEIEKLTDEKTAIKEKENSLIKGIESTYKNTLEKLKASYIKNGASLTCAFDKERAENLKEKELKIVSIKAETSESILLIEQKINRLNDLLLNAENNFVKIEEEEILRKIDELKEEEQKQEIEIQKYNSSLHEKEVKYRNSYAKMTADLKFKYASLAQVELSKSQLIELGYYKDVLDCASLYYNSIPAVDAYNDILNDSNIKVYLEDYYQPFLYTYQLKI